VVVIKKIPYTPYKGGAGVVVIKKIPYTPYKGGAG
jgi:hypothetical protein